MPKVSVIIPVYGVEKYIERCARSLMEQTLDDLEFIFVDDCTKDASIDILKRVVADYPNRTDQVKIIHHDENMGLPQARRTGVLASTGDFIAHCDSDDWMEQDAYELLYHKAVETQADMIFFDYTRTDGISYEDHLSNIEGISRDQLIAKMIAGQVLYGVVFHLDARHLYTDDGFEWPKYNNAEDLLFTIQLLCRVTSFSKINKVLYNYFYNPNSLTKSSENEEKNAQIIHNIESLMSVIQKSSLSMKELYILLCKMRIKQRYIHRTSSKEGYRLWRNTYPEVGLSVIFNINVPIIMRIRYFLGYMRLYSCVKRFI